MSVSSIRYSSRRQSGGTTSEEEGFELVDFDTTGRRGSLARTLSISSSSTENTRVERLAELKLALAGGIITPNQRKNVERLISDLENGIEWYLYEDGKHVTHLTRNFSRVLWKEISPDDI